MAPEPTEDRDLLIEAVKEAGLTAMEHFRASPEVWEKSDGTGPVTEADLAVNRALRTRLRGARGDYGWLSEEDDDGAERLRRDRVFIVDPIDGTRAFIAGEPGFSIAVAVVERGRPVAAAVHLPALGETFAAAEGRGAVKNGALIRASERDRMEDATILAARVQMQPDRWAGGVPPVQRHFRSSLAWRLCLVAEGRFDMMATFRRSYEWDIAAGVLIAGEAGAEVSDGEGRGLVFNTPEGTQPGVIAAPRALHGQMLRHRRGD